MGAVKLELRYPQSIGGVVIDPQPDWSFETLLSEISSIEKKLNASSNLPLPFTKSKSRHITHSPTAIAFRGDVIFELTREVSSAKSVERKTFVMRVDEMEDAEEDSEDAASGQQVVAGGRFTCDEFYVSDSYDSEDESLSGAQGHLMDKMGLVEGALSELTHEHQLSGMEEITSRILALEADLMTDYKKFTTALSQVKRHTEARREMDRKLDMQYQRRIAEALDNHLTAIQRDHEHKSQLEERRIRDDAAVEEVKRREKALQEEKLRQEKARAEAEMHARLEAEKKRAEEVKAAALEADRKAAKEAAEKVAKGDSARVATAAVSPIEAMGLQTGTSSGIPNDQSDKSGSNRVIKAQQSGNILKGAESALKLEERRLQIYKEVAAKNEALGLGSSSNHLSHGSKIQRLIKQISGTKENVRNKADQLTKILSDSSCPQTITIAMFADKMVDQCVNPNKVVFAYAHVIVLVASQVPLAMDLLLAKLNTVCIYTVPKYITYSKSAFETKEAYYKAIGYQEEDGEIETEESYVSRIESYMRLYGALVQTEGVQNTHDLKQGWAWLARFLNALPANLYTAVALHAFLEMAGFALYRRYKSQFKKLLNLIHRDFVKALKEREGDAKLNKVVTSIQTYIESNKFLEEPEGRSLQSSLLSHTFVPESEYSQSSYHHPINRFTYQY